MSVFDKEFKSKNKKKTKKRVSTKKAYKPRKEVYLYGKNLEPIGEKK